AAGPKFPVFLLPSFSMPFRGRRQSGFATEATSSIGTSPPSEAAVPPLSSSPSDSSPSSPGDTATSSYSTTPPIASHPRRLSRTQPNTIRCSTCSTDFAYCSQVVSKGFTGRYGRAYLIAPVPNQGGSLLNIKIGKSETRLLVTGSHIVADITCAVCQARVGWKYVDAKEESQKYKVGKFILETQRTVDYRSWEDVPESESRWPGDQKGGAGDSHEDIVVFDSEDEDDCDDLFAGSWDPAVAARRRAR
ncbi:yippee zinc-binding/DNA-binding /Mis18, centromere assembly-domain-containing protein, partial [Microdochium trichocladiopsis]